MSQRVSQHRPTGVPITRTPEVWKIGHSDESRKLSFKTNFNTSDTAAFKTAAGKHESMREQEI